MSSQQARQVPSARGDMDGRVSRTLFDPVPEGGLDAARGHAFGSTYLLQVLVQQRLGALPQHGRHLVQTRGGHGGCCRGVGSEVGREAGGVLPLGVAGGRHGASFKDDGNAAADSSERRLAWTVSGEGPAGEVRFEGSR